MAWDINGQFHVSTGLSARGIVLFLPPLAHEDILMTTQLTWICKCSMLCQVVVVVAGNLQDMFNNDTNNIHTFQYIIHDLITNCVG